MRCLLLRRRKKNIFYLFMKWLHGKKIKKAPLHTTSNQAQEHMSKCSFRRLHKVDTTPKTVQYTRTDMPRQQQQDLNPIAATNTWQQLNPTRTTKKLLSHSYQLVHNQYHSGWPKIPRHGIDLRPTIPKLVTRCYHHMVVGILVRKNGEPLKLLNHKSKTTKPKQNWRSAKNLLRHTLFLELRTGWRSTRGQWNQLRGHLHMLQNAHPS